ncbi:hypothetical protein [Afipia felis]
MLAAAKVRQRKQFEASISIKSFRNFLSKLRRAASSIVTSLRRDIGNIVHCEIFGVRRVRYAKREIVPLRNCNDGYAPSETLEWF